MLKRRSGEAWHCAIAMSLAIVGSISLINDSNNYLPLPTNNLGDKL